jgi:hypothetical protein
MFSSEPNFASKYQTSDYSQRKFLEGSFPVHGEFLGRDVLSTTHTTPSIGTRGTPPLARPLPSPCDPGVSGHC